MHPGIPDLAGDGDIPEVDKTVAESRLSAERLHRMEFISKHDVNIQCNVTLPFEQISPLPGQQFKESLAK